MKKAKLIKKYNIKKRNVYLLIVIIIFFTTFLIYKNFSNNIDRKILRMIHDKLDIINTTVVSRAINSEFLSNINIDDILIVNKNKNEEIILIDFNMNNSYKILRKVLGNLEDSILRLQAGDIEQIFYEDDDVLSKNGLIIRFPLGMLSKYTFINNLGPRIPLKIQLGGSAVAGFDTKITDYGLNNSLIQVFIKCNLNEQVYLPLEVKKVSFEYEFLIAVKIIQGKVPTYYGGALNTRSPILSLPIN